MPVFARNRYAWQSSGAPGLISQDEGYEDLVDTTECFRKDSGTALSPDEMQVSETKMNCYGFPLRLSVRKLV